LGYDDRAPQFPQISLKLRVLFAGNFKTLLDWNI